MQPMNRPITPTLADGARRPVDLRDQRTPGRSRARAAAAGIGMLAGALLAWGASAAAHDGAGSDLDRLGALVRHGAADALARLQAVQGQYEGAAYAERLGYLQLLARAYR